MYTARGQGEGAVPEDELRTGGPLGGDQVMLSKQNPPDILRPDDTHGGPA